LAACLSFQRHQPHQPHQPLHFPFDPLLSPVYIHRLLSQLYLNTILPDMSPKRSSDRSIAPKKRVKNSRASQQSQQEQHILILWSSRDLSTVEEILSTGCSVRSLMLQSIQQSIYRVMVHRHQLLQLPTLAISLISTADSKIDTKALIGWIYHDLWSR